MWTSQTDLQNNDASNQPERFTISSLGLLLILGLVSCQSPSPSIETSSGQENVVEEAIASTSQPSSETTNESSPSGTTGDSSLAQHLQSESVFEGGGFTVTITGSGSSAAYRGCNANQECLEIPQAANYARGTYTWENGGYTYVMAPVTVSSDTETDSGAYQLRVYDPSRNTIADAIMAPVTGNGSDDKGGDVVLEPNILDNFYTQAETLGACPDYFDLEASKNASATYSVNDNDAVVEVLCFLAAYQGAYEYWLYQATESGGEFTRLSFDSYTAGESGGYSQIQVQELGGLPTYDPAQETLTVFTKYRGLGDCGSYSEYQWQGTGFELVTYRSKDECDGTAMEPIDYPQIYP